MRLIFLDIDGVLNDHNYDNYSQSSSFDRECVRCFNAIIAATNPHIVISSAWRYMVHKQAMTIRGFEYLLRTHGLHVVDRVIGCTPLDEEIPEREHQILKWVHDHKPASWCVLDDLELCFGEHQGRFVKIANGLIEPDIERAVKVLTGKEISMAFDVPKASHFECYIDGVLADEKHPSYQFSLNERWGIAHRLEKLNMLNLSEADKRTIDDALRIENAKWKKMDIKFSLATNSEKAGVANTNDHRSQASDQRAADHLLWQ